MIWVVAMWIYSYVKIYWLYIEKQCTFDNLLCHTFSGFPVDSAGKEPTCQFRRHREVGSIPGWGRSPGLGDGNPLQYSCMENSMDRGAWWPIVHRVAKSQTQLKRLSMQAHFSNVEKENKNRKNFKKFSWSWAEYPLNQRRSIAFNLSYRLWPSYIFLQR